MTLTELVAELHSVILNNVRVRNSKLNKINNNYNARVRNSKFKKINSNLIVEITDTIYTPWSW